MYTFPHTTKQQGVKHYNSVSRKWSSSCDERREKKRRLIRNSCASSSSPGNVGSPVGREASPDCQRLRQPRAPLYGTSVAFGGQVFSSESRAGEMSLLLAAGLLLLLLLGPAECRLPAGVEGCRPLMVDLNDPARGQCPINVSSVPSKDVQQGYSENIRVLVLIEADDFVTSPKIEISIPSERKKTFRLFTRKKDKPKDSKSPSEFPVKCGRDVTQPSRQSSRRVNWEFVYSYSAKADAKISVTYRTNSTNCSVTYTVPDPKPDYSVSVNKSSKTVLVSVDSGDRVKIRLCYENRASHCAEIIPPRLVSQTVDFNITYMLPCVCVEAFYDYLDARRHKKCPFKNGSLTDFDDVLRASRVLLYRSQVTWTSKCPNSKLNVSASLCWKQHPHLCIPVINSTLEKKDGPTLVFNTSTVDKHPQMCVQFSTQGRRNISCLFEDILSSWETHIGSGSRSISVFLTSSSPAKFSAQLCLLTEGECTPTGPIHSVTMGELDTEKRINVPVHVPAEKPCVQVWQSSPALNGRRILCPDYTHSRWGVCAAAAFTFLTAVTLFVLFIHRVIKKGAAGWLTIQKPLLVVCSSDASTHVSAVCALASLLQGELGATVYTALWAQTSQRPAGGRSGVADLGPLPWLYGQWDAVRKAQGRVLVVWSLEAKRTYQKWREERENTRNNERKNEDSRKTNGAHKKMSKKADVNLKLNARKVKCKKEKAVIDFWEDDDGNSQKEASAVTEPVFVAALASLEEALKGCKAQEVAIVYFQGLSHSRDIPKALRGVPRYCLPQDFSGLIQELGEVRKGPKTGESGGHCWPKLLCKVLSVWLARQLAQRLQTQLPQTQRQKGEEWSITSSVSPTESKHKFPPASGPADALQQELLQGSPWRTERL